jgi:hypothetical protein
MLSYLAASGRPRKWPDAARPWSGIIGLKLGRVPYMMAGSIPARVPIEPL